MLKERIQEIFDFTKSESPYRKANKGWINQDIFLDLSVSSNNLNEKNEAAKVTLLWSPINNLLSNIFLIIIIGSILVFSSLSFVKGRFNLKLFNTNLVSDIVHVEKKNLSKISQSNDLESMNSKIEQSNDKTEINESKNIKSSNDNLVNSNQEILTNKIDKKERTKKDSASNKDMKVLKNKKSTFT